MDAVKFLEEVKRMCESHSTCVVDDKVCPIVCHRNGYCIGPALKSIEVDKFPNIVNAVDEWSKENSIKTRASEFMKHYPNVINCEGVPIICPKTIDVSYNPCSGCSKIDCYDCRKEYWMQEVE